MKVNRSKLYLLPLIRDWSANADLPSSCYASTKYPHSVICKYLNGIDESRMHPNGTILGLSKHEDKYVLYFIRECFESDFDLIMHGKYSEISEVAKKMILSRSPSNSDYEFLESVLYKSKKYKRQLEKDLAIKDLDQYVSEYDSVFDSKELFIEEV